MDAALKAILEYGITVVAVVVLALFVFWLIRKGLEAQHDQIVDIRGQRDIAIAGWQGATTAIEKLTDALRERNDLEERVAARSRR